MILGGSRGLRLIQIACGFGFVLLADLAGRYVGSSPGPASQIGLLDYPGWTAWFVCLFIVGVGLLLVRKTGGWPESVGFIVLIVVLMIDSWASSRWR